MTPTPHARFVALHEGAAPLMLANAWDAGSARIFEDAGAPAIATSSAAVAWARGYPDGDALPPAELIDCVRGIARVCRVPLTVDVESGYSDDPRAVARLVADVVDAGAVGINIEDGQGEPGLLADKIAAIRDALGATPCFINARTDVLLAALATGDAALEMIERRFAQYAAAGADGGFVPGLSSVEQARALAAATPLRLNVMALPQLPPADALHAAGVCRISAGVGPYRVALANARDAVRALLAGDAAPLFSATLDYVATNRLFAPAR